MTCETECEYLIAPSRVWSRIEHTAEEDISSADQQYGGNRLMIGKYERQSDILKVIEGLDITPTMYRNAEEKYKALADYLGSHTDVPTTMYPQGSFYIWYSSQANKGWQRSRI